MEEKGTNANNNNNKNNNYYNLTRLFIYFKLHFASLFIKYITYCLHYFPV